MAYSSAIAPLSSMPTSARRQTWSWRLQRQRWRRWLIDKRNRPLCLAFALSLFIHALVLSLHFGGLLVEKEVEPTLDIILVNAASERPPEPTQAQARAQVSLDGGGNTEHDHRQTSPLAAHDRDQLGEEQERTARRQTPVTVKFRSLLTRRNQARVRLPVDSQATANPPSESHYVHGRDPHTAQQVILQLEAEVARALDERNKMPKKQYLSPRTLAYAAAAYLENWSDKVERLGNLTYPEEARGRLYGSVAVLVELTREGAVHHLEIMRSSGFAVLDRAVMRFIHQAAPFGPIPTQALNGNDLLSFTRVIVFDRDGGAQVQASEPQATTLLEPGAEGSWGRLPLSAPSLGSDSERR